MAASWEVMCRVTQPQLSLLPAGSTGVARDRPGRHKGGAAHQPEARPEPRSLSPTAARSRSDPVVTSHPGPRHSSWFANYFFMDEVSCAKKLQSVTMQSSRPCAQFGHLFRVALHAPERSHLLQPLDQRRGPRRPSVVRLCQGTRHFNQSIKQQSPTTNILH